MKHTLIIKKGREVKNGVINLHISKEKMTAAFLSHGWKVLHLEPEENIKLVDVRTTNHGIQR